MDKFNIYLSGGMSNLSLEEQTVWRKTIRDAIKFGDYDYEKTPIFLTLLKDILYSKKSIRVNSKQ